MHLVEKDDQAKHLNSRIEEFLKWSKKKYKFNNRFHVFLLCLGLVSSSFTGYFGLVSTENSVLAGSLGIFTTFLIALQNAFKFNEKSYVYLNLHNDAKNLRDELSYEVNNRSDVINVSNKFKKLKTNGLESLPKESNLESNQNS
ncbi:hypothetical protein [Neptuniibacter sp. QD37_11]|uniref:hypothetical protein n=1 Tax=Neptuniibacter sp. QD37_11 TaxID=3398209 RepID=UPI0039F5E201